jgi:hypothetical protein
MRSKTTFFLTALAFGAFSAPAFAERVIVKCPASCDAVVQAIEGAGGTVTHRYKYIKAVAADVPSNQLSAVRKVAGEASVRKDLMVTTEMSARDPRTGASLLLEAEAEAVGALDAEALAGEAAAAPQAYLINNAMSGVDALHAAGFTGAGAVVAVLDSGIRPNFPHLSLDGSVIGGENFVPDANGFSNPANSGHGTFVAGMISANVNFNFAAHPWRAAIAAECPGCLTPAGVLPVRGSAPLSSIYAMRVLNSQGSGATSWILAGMERVIDVRRAYDAGATPVADATGKYNALNIRVANMSLGGATLYAGRDIEDEMTNAFLENDIVLVVAAGNQGPGGATVGSPGSGASSLTVGAAGTAVHERILRNIQFGVGIGSLYRPFSGTQTAYFSSRGPTADGRVDPNIVANGFANFGMGTGATTGTLSIGSGTSYASPTIAGIAAVLRQAVPAATARQVYNALLASADASAVQDGSGPLDRGAGFVNAVAARALLQDWTSVSDAAPGYGIENKNVNVNILQGADVKTWSGDVTRSVSGLLPGQRFETFYKVTPNTGAVVVTLANVVPGAVQNALFGDDIMFTVHSAKTSSIGASGDYKVFTLSTGGTFTIPKPDQGIMRITLSGDWTNASPIAATVNIHSVTEAEPGLTRQGKIADGEVIAIPFTVPVGAQQLSARLEWDGDWSNYPTNDLDVLLQRPNGTFVTAGASLNAPERAEVAAPPAGNWVAYVDGFTVSTKGGDRFKLRIVIDGQVIK